MDNPLPSPPLASPRDAAPARKPKMWKSPWFKTLLSFCTVLLVLAACVEIYRHATNYGKSVVESHPVDARIEIVNPPDYLDRQIINSLLDEAYKFAQKDEATYHRARNVLDGAILREFADLYTGTETLDGKPSPRQAVGYNAWIERITEVRRNVAADKSIQTIQIFAQWRQPVAWMRVQNQLYLIDAQGTRLPGDYRLEDRPRSKLLVITGADLPLINGTAGVPRAGETWAAGKDNSLAGDLLSGMRLVERLRKQQFVAQIDAINVSNYAGRKDPRAAWIMLDTIWQTADGSPRVVQWGRPMGEEKYYEVQSEVKIKTLNEIYQRFSRIDAGRDYVDIRTEVVRLPKLALVPTP